MFKHLIFDFDGTLADTEDILIDCINELAPQYGYPVSTKEQLTEYKGKSFRELLKLFKIPVYKLPGLAKVVREKISAKLAAVKAFPDIPMVLKALHDNGIKLYIMSSNSKENINSLIKRDNLEFFESVNSSIDVFGKAGAIKKVMKKHGLDPSSCAYVGDEVRDIEACKKIPVAIISVAWGYNNETVLLKNKPDYFVKNPKEIQDLILAQSKAV